MMAARDKRQPQAAQTEDATVTRIVIGLDTSFLTREALSLAARLAASMDARLKGIFVEDENLLALSGLPFAREVSFSGEVRELDPERMLRAMRAQAESARRVLARVAAEAHVDWSFDVKRGRPLSSIAANAGADDTLVIRSASAPSGEVGRTVRAATLDAHADVLLVARGIGLKGAFATAALPPGVAGRGVASVDEGSSRGESCTAFAETLAARIGAPFRRLDAKGRNPADIAAMAKAAGIGLLIVNAGWLGDDEDAAHLSSAAGCPILLLGAEREPRPASSPAVKGD
ncbi:hypothetical protein [Parvibaculum sp.]|uniref:hypothetical protein n=1 Tax=Parvibaculum sp. TaxID=2024848 RepID=UPI00349FFA17